jgi:hypothetical protein
MAIHYKGRVRMTTNGQVRFIKGEFECRIKREVICEMSGSYKQPTLEPAAIRPATESVQAVATYPFLAPITKDHIGIY